MKDEPKRWATPGSDAPRALRDLLVTGRKPLGDSAEVAALRARLAPMLAAPPNSVEPAMPRPSRALSKPRVLSWVAGGIGTAAVAWVIASQLPHATTSEPSEPSTPTESAPAPSAPTPSAPTPSTALENAAAPVEPPAATLDAATHRAEPVPPSPPRASSKPPPTRPAAPQVDEAELLKRAQAALATRPAEALSLTERHARLFARGALAEERDVIAILALRSLGRNRAADQRAARFEQRHPGSVHLEKLRGK